MKTDMGEHMFPPTSVSEENQDRYSEIMSQVKTLADEMEASFICGTTPMSRVGFLPAEAEGCRH